MKGTTDGDTFYSFIQTHLLPHLLSFDGKLDKHSVVVMDKCSINHVQQVITSIQYVAAIVHFLPPDFNPIEELFVKVKLELKSIFIKLL